MYMKACMEALTWMYGRTPRAKQ